MHVAIVLIVLLVVMAFLIPVIGVNVIFLVLGAVIAWAIIMRNKSIKENMSIAATAFLVNVSSHLLYFF